MTEEDNQRDGGQRASDESKRDLPGSAPEERVDHTQDDVSANKCPKCEEPVHEKRVSCPNCGHEYTKDDYTTDPEPDEFSVEDTSFMEEGDGEGDGGDASDHAHRTDEDTGAERGAAE